MAQSSEVEDMENTALFDKIESEITPKKNELSVIKVETTLKKQSSSTASKKARYETQTSHDLTFFLQQQKEGAQRTLITPQIRFVMFQFLITTVKPFTHEFLTKNVLELIFKRAVFKESRRADTKSPSEYLYTYGKGCNYFILIISGEATIEVGKEKLEFPSGPFAYFGVNALLSGCETAEQVLQDETVSLSSDAESSLPLAEANKAKSASKQYIPDFSLRVDDRCVYMKVDRDLWRSGVIKSRYEYLNNQKSDSIDYLPNGQKSDTDLSSVASKPDNSNGSLGVFFSKKNSEPNSPQLKLDSPAKFNNSRRSTIAATALAKMQELANNKNNNRLQNLKSHQLQQLKELSDSQEQLEMNTLIISEEIINETEPFLSKKYSSSSQTIDNQKNRILADKDDFTTLSQKSCDD